MPHIRLKHWIIGAGVLVLLFVQNVLFGIGNQWVIYDFTPLFKGWVLIQYEDPACTALPTGTWSIHIPIPESGCVCTSDTLALGPRQTRYKRVHLDGTSKDIPDRWHDNTSEIWSHITGMGPSKSVHKPFLREAFFVGSGEEFDKQYKLNPVGPQFPEQKICTELDDHARLK
jgi:hypothetical protein